MIFPAINFHSVRTFAAFLGIAIIHPPRFFGGEFVHSKRPAHAAQWAALWQWRGEEPWMWWILFPNPEKKMRIFKHLPNFWKKHRNIKHFKHLHLRKVRSNPSISSYFKKDVSCRSHKIGAPGDSVTPFPASPQDGGSLVVCGCGLQWTARERRAGRLVWPVPHFGMSRQMTDRFSPQVLPVFSVNTIFHGRTHYKWWFSIAMLVYQRVIWNTTLNEAIWFFVWNFHIHWDRLWGV